MFASALTFWTPAERFRSPNASALSSGCAIWPSERRKSGRNRAGMNFLLEIGTEEIPHWMIPGALKQLAELNLLGATPRVDATPRRLVVQAEGVPERTPDEQQIVKGPPLTAGERAAAGFAKKQGVDPTALTKTGRVLRTQAPGPRPQQPGYSRGDHLPPRSSPFSGRKRCTGPRKTDRVSSAPFAGSSRSSTTKSIPFEIAGVHCGGVTRGHRQLGSPSITVTPRKLRIRTAQEFRHPLVARTPPQDRERSLGPGCQNRCRSARNAHLHHRIPHGHPRRVRSQIPRAPRRSPQHGDAPSPEIFLRRIRAGTCSHRISWRS